MELLQFSLVQSLSHVQLFAAPWTAARQASLFITNSQSLLKLMSIESVMTSNHLILCRPLLLLPSIFPSIRVFTNESVLRIRWPKDWLLRLVITSLPRSKRLLISCLQSWSLLTLGISWMLRVPPYSCWAPEVTLGFLLMTLTVTVMSFSEVLRWGLAMPKRWILWLEDWGFRPPTGSPSSLPWEGTWQETEFNHMGNN